MRAINLIDSYGVVGLIGRALRTLKEGKAVYFIADDSNTTKYLKSSKFFRELKRLQPKTVFFDEPLIDSLSVNSNLENLFLPLKYIGARGQERKVAMDNVFEKLTRKDSDQIIDKFLENL